MDDVAQSLEQPLIRDGFNQQQFHPKQNIPAIQPPVLHIQPEDLYEQVPAQEKDPLSDIAFHQGQGEAEDFIPVYRPQREEDLEAKPEILVPRSSPEKFSHQVQLENSPTVHDLTVPEKKHGKLEAFLESKRMGWLILFSIYLVAVLLAYGLLKLLTSIADEIIQVLVVDLIISCFVVTLNMLFPRSSLYDPFWNLMTFFISWYWYLNSSNQGSTQSVLAIIAVTAYTARHFVQFSRSWKGLSDESFVYAEVKEKLYDRKFFYNLVYIFGIHLIPTLIIFCGCIPLYYIFDIGSRDDNFFIGLGFFSAMMGIVFQIIAEFQLPNQQREDIASGERFGLWNYTRHPDYLGDVAFWFGCYFMALGTSYSKWWTFFGPVLILLMIYFVGIPVLESHLAKRSQGYNEYQNQVSRLLPWKSSRTVENQSALRETS